MSIVGTWTISKFENRVELRCCIERQDPRVQASFPRKWQRAGDDRKIRAYLRGKARYANRKKVRARDSERDSHPLYSRALEVGYVNVVFTVCDLGTRNRIAKENNAKSVPNRETNSGGFRMCHRKLFIGSDLTGQTFIGDVSTKLFASPQTGVLRRFATNS
jgi:hypothetical protein